MRLVPLALLLLAGASPASAQQGALRALAAEETALREEVAALGPVAARAWEEAVVATRRDDWGRAELAYARVQELAPKFAPAPRRRSQVAQTRGLRAEAIAFARQALALADQPAGHSTLAAALLLRGPLGEPPPPADVDTAITEAAAAAQLLPDDYLAQATLCRAAFERRRGDLLLQCSKALQRLAPDDPVGDFAAAVAAALAGKKEEATRLFALAHQKGLPVEAIAAVAPQLGLAPPAGPMDLKSRIGSIWLLGLLGLLLVGAILGAMAVVGAARGRRR